MTSREEPEKAVADFQSIDISESLDEVDVAFKAGYVHALTRSSAVKALLEIVKYQANWAENEQDLEGAGIALDIYESAIKGVGK